MVQKVNLTGFEGRKSWNGYRGSSCRATLAALQDLFLPRLCVGYVSRLEVGTVGTRPCTRTPSKRRCHHTHDPTSFGIVGPIPFRVLNSTKTVTSVQTVSCLDGFDAIRHCGPPQLPGRTCQKSHCLTCPTHP